MSIGPVAMGPGRTTFHAYMDELSRSVDFLPDQATLSVRLPPFFARRLLTCLHEVAEQALDASDAPCPRPSAAWS